MSTGKIVQGDVSIGKALAKLTGTYDMHGETTSIDTKLSGQGMPVDDLEAMLPAVGVILPTGSKLKGERFRSNSTPRVRSTNWFPLAGSR